MNPACNHLLSTALHVLEFALVLALAFAIAHFFPEHRDMALVIVGLVGSSVTKFMRTSPDVPVPDYVNGTNQ